MWYNVFIKTSQEVDIMQEILGTKVDTASMTLEELKVARDKARNIKANYAEKNTELFLQLQEILINVNHQISMRMFLANRYS